MDMTKQRPILVLCATGETRRRIVERLNARGRPVRVGRNVYLSDRVQRALGRPPRDFRDFARDAAATGIWGHSVAAA
jgi:hypothetical protein